jgi:hypothetical protein
VTARKREPPAYARAVPNHALRGRRSCRRRVVRVAQSRPALFQCRFGPCAGLRRTYRLLLPSRQQKVVAIGSVLGPPRRTIVGRPEVRWQSQVARGTGRHLPLVLGGARHKRLSRVSVPPATYTDSVSQPDVEERPTHRTNVSRRRAPEAGPRNWGHVNREVRPLRIITHCEPGRRVHEIDDRPTAEAASFPHAGARRPGQQIPPATEPSPSGSPPTAHTSDTRQDMARQHPAGRGLPASEALPYGRVVGVRRAGRRGGRGRAGAYDRRRTNGRGPRRYRQRGVQGHTVRHAGAVRGRVGHRSGDGRHGLGGWCSSGRSGVAVPDCPAGSSGGGVFRGFGAVRGPLGWRW